MSRFNAVSNNGRSFVYGFDHVFAYFIQEFDPNGECVLDIDTLSHGTFLAKCEEFAIVLPKQHRMEAVLDLPFSFLEWDKDRDHEVGDIIAHAFAHLGVVYLNMEEDGDAHRGDAFNIAPDNL